MRQEDRRSTGASGSHIVPSHKERQEMSTRRDVLSQQPHQEQTESQSLAPAWTGGACTTRRAFLGQLAGTAAAMAVADAALGTRTARAHPAAIPQAPGG